jgi:two-component system, cell cycle response regulator CpdR
MHVSLAECQRKSPLSSKTIPLFYATNFRISALAKRARLRNLYHNKDLSHDPRGVALAAPARQRTGLDLMSRILLAEDDNDMRRFLVRALQNAGYDVASFDNGLSAYNRLREEPFDLLLTDIVMPEMDGIELARRATELDPDIKVMFITGFAAVALNPDSNAPRDAKVLSKPFHLKDLVAEVQKIVQVAA